LSSRAQRATIIRGVGELSSYLWNPAMAQRQPWNPIPSVVYGVAAGVCLGALIISIFEGGDRWQDQAGVLLEITMATTLASMAVSYVRQSISN
jgi:hypothetical protein